MLTAASFTPVGTSGNPYNLKLSPRRSPSDGLFLANSLLPVKRKIAFGKSFLEKKPLSGRRVHGLKMMLLKNIFSN
jgi:hypothetical protein